MLAIDLPKITAQVAQQLKLGGMALRMDTSLPMLKAAYRRQLTSADLPAGFRQADARCDILDNATFDAAHWRFGVIFISNTAANFANVRLALKTIGLLSFAPREALKRDDWMRAPVKAESPLMLRTQMRTHLGASDFFHLPSDLASTMLLSQRASKASQWRAMTRQSSARILSKR